MLPEGLRDLLPERAARRRAVAHTVLGSFERYGYATVVPPAFERESVVARGVGGAARRELLRFLDPDAGDVLVLRPDMTPQIARLASTRYREHPGPLRLSYEGSVVRRPRGRAHRQRQVSQAGIECIGFAPPQADVEVIAATLDALHALGLHGLTVELSHAGALSAVIDALPGAVRERVAEAVAARDGASWRALLAGDDLAHVEMLTACAGVAEALDGWSDALRARGHGDVVDALAAVARGLRGARAQVLVDLGELRGRGYYTGAFFQVLVDGVGTPLALGGRYDALLGRYGAPRPATGAAIDLEAVETALANAGIEHRPAPRRVLVVGAAEARAGLAAGLRAAGRSVAESDPADDDTIAALVAWEGYSEVLRADGG
jgi:ATP phosphoribosyltransferase regulatory subunit